MVEPRTRLSALVESTLLQPKYCCLHTGPVVGAEELDYLSMRINSSSNRNSSSSSNSSDSGENHKSRHTPQLPQTPRQEPAYALNLFQTGSLGNMRTSHTVQAPSLGVFQGRTYTNPTPHHTHLLALTTHPLLPVKPSQAKPTTSPESANPRRPHPPTSSTATRNSQRPSNTQRTKTLRREAAGYNVASLRARAAK